VLVIDDPCDDMGVSAVRATQTLHRVAGVLGLPVSTFYGASDEPLAGAAELLRLWEMIACDADRARVLAFAREVVTNQASLL
jgi:hypothetical protein